MRIRDQLAASVRITTPVAKATGMVPLSDYRWLTPDRKVQQSIFENGVRATVNFGDAPYTFPDGTLLPPRGHHIQIK